MQEKLDRAKRRILEQQKIKEQQAEVQRQKDAQQKSEQNEQLRLKNAEGVRLITQAMDHLELNEILEEIENRIKKTLQKVYPHELASLLEGSIKFPLQNSGMINEISFVYNNFKKGVIITATYRSDIGSAENPPTTYENHFSSVDELVDALVDGIAYYELGEPDFNIFNFYSLTRKRD